MNETDSNENGYLKLLENLEKTFRSYSKHLPQDSFIIAVNESEIETYRKDPDSELRDPHLLFKYLSLSQPNDFPFVFYLTPFAYAFEFALGSSYTGGLDDVEKAEKEIKTILQMLLSGQLAILRTVHGNRVYAQEILLFDDKNNPKVILTDAVFPLFASKDISTQLLRNRIREFKYIKPSKDFILYPADEKGNYPFTGRKLKSLDTPLTKKEATSFMQKVAYGNAVGADGNTKSLYKKMFTSWITYALFIPAIFIAFILPDSLSTPAAMFMSFIIFWVILPRVLR